MSEPRPYVLLEANLRQLLDNAPNVAILPWGATEAHNYHLPHGTDAIQAEALANETARLASAEGAKPVVLPTIPFGNNAQQLDQVATIHFSTDTASSILNDICLSLTEQGIDRLIIINAHGGNDFKPLIRDKQLEFEMLIVVCNFWQMVPEALADIFDEPGDHAGEMETSLLMHLCPDFVKLEQAGPGERVPFDVESLRQAGTWTPRPWSAVHPDTGAGNPKESDASKGKRFFNAVSEAIAKVIVGVSAAHRGDVPYI